MSIKYLSPIDLTQNELQNARIQNLATDPTSPVVGQIWFNSTGNVLKVYDGSVRVLGELSNTLNQFAAPTTALLLNGQLISNVATPVSQSDAATKGYVDGVALGLDVKPSVRVATTTAGTLTTSFASGQTVDGVVLATGDRILIKNQATASENGIYIVAASGAPTRSTDTNTSANYVSGSFTFTELGSINQGAAFVVNTPGTITPGTTAVTWVQFSGSSTTANNLSGGTTGSVVYQSAAGVTQFLTGNSAATDQVLVSHGSGSAALAPTLSNSPVLSAANMSSFPTLNQNTTGNAATATSATTATNFTGSLAGDVTGAQGSTTVGKINGVTLSGLSTGLLKITTATGVPSTAAAGTDYLAPNGSASALTNFPVLNQSTTGNAATATSAAALSTTLPVTGGGTGATTPVAARTALGAVGKFAATIGDGSTSSIVVTHNLGTTDCHVACFFVGTPFQVVQVETQMTSANTITLVFAAAPTSNQFRVVVIG